MQSTSSASTGHCKAILSKGPFKIGIDFEPPVPVARMLWHVTLDDHVLNALEACVRRAGAPTDGPIEQDGAETDEVIFDRAMRESELEKGVCEALDWFISDTQFQPAERDVRAHVRKLKQQIDLFESALPSEQDAVGHFIQRTYTGDAFLKDGFKPNKKMAAKLQQAWRVRYGFDATREHLEVMKAYVAAASECLGKKKPLEHRNTRLIRTLARTWKRLTGRWPMSGRIGQPAKQAGAFADFVRIAYARLPEPFGGSPLNAAIRRVCEAPDPE
jgi:hypothetical protein